MAQTLTYPGVYIEEVPSGVRTITGVATSITAFVGFALRGPVNTPTRIQSFAEFERVFGGLWIDSSDELRRAAVLPQRRRRRAHRPRDPHRGHERAAGHEGDAGDRRLQARGAERGQLGQQPPRPCRLRHSAGRHERSPARRRRRCSTSRSRTWRRASSSRSSTSARSRSTRATSRASSRSSPTSSGSRHPGRCPLPSRPTTRPSRSETIPSTPAKTTSTAFGTDGHEGTGSRGGGSHSGQPEQEGHLRARRRPTSSTCSCIPPRLDATACSASARAAAASKYCHDRRAMFIVDPDPDAGTQAQRHRRRLGAHDVHAGIDSAERGALLPVAATCRPAQRPARPTVRAVGRDRRRVRAHRRAAAASGRRRPGSTRRSPASRTRRAARPTARTACSTRSGSTACATFPVFGTVVWGARTLVGADQHAREWKYVPVRRLGALPRGEPLPRDAVGRLRAERRAAVGADPAQRRRVHAQPVPPGRLPGHDAARGVLRQVRRRDDDAERHRPRAS